MAWTEQCKVAFEVNAEGRLAKQGKRKNLTEIFKKLSEESGIPQKTLSRWWYEKQKEKEEFEKNLLKIEQNEQGTRMTTEASEPDVVQIVQIPLCNKCGKNPVHITQYGKPLTRKSADHDLCNSCRGRKKRATKPCVCPTCGHKHTELEVESEWN